MSRDEAESYNAVIGLGHRNGTVTMWSPSMNEPLVKIFAHPGGLTDIAFDLEGRYMATTGHDCRVSILDIRKFEKVHSYFSPARVNSLDISQNGLLAVGCGYQAQIWRDGIATKAKSPYMRVALPGTIIHDLNFRPYEDVLSIGHKNGFMTALIPGAGEANYDSRVANPFETSKQRREGEVKSLLDKLNPDMIVLNPAELGTVDGASRETIAKEKLEAFEARLAAAEGRKVKAKKKMRGKNKIGKRIKRKHMNIMDEARMKRREEKEENARKQKAAKEGRKMEEETGALARFSK